MESPSAYNGFFVLTLGFVIALNTKYSSYMVLITMARTGFNAWRLSFFQVVAAMESALAWCGRKLVVVVPGKTSSICAGNDFNAICNLSI